ncbi:hypothetical protein SAMN02745121_08528 [Nannocystis exedens]|uniref:Lipoprotein n=1 Tax=Nannocystis exedens TaxID=54 RepID=A0A1I2IDK3_9BACT|nr:hypothetical protein [Nannocystis exedens]PCC72990.1 hypothetical protein NAEX_06076 [Nannocystis exedens]SFF38611.1 hypothetical protein SAMN02745121_08528 [Nannocystis exedens]
MRFGFLLPAIVAAACGGSGGAMGESDGMTRGPDTGGSETGDEVEGPCLFSFTGEWDVSVVAEKGLWGSFAIGSTYAFAMSGDGGGFVYRGERELMYAVRDGDTFRAEKVEGLGSYPLKGAALVYHEGAPVIGFAVVSTWGTTSLMLRSGDEWLEEEVAPEPYDFALALAPDGSPELLTLQAGNLYHSARLPGGGYSEELIASAKVEGGTVSVSNAAMAIDASGKRHVVYRRANDEMYYAESSPEGWVVEKIASDMSDVTPAIALDGAGTIFIIYATTDEVAALATRSLGGTFAASTLGAVPTEKLVLLTSETGEVFAAWYEEEPALWHIRRPDGSESTYIGPGHGLALSDGLLHAMYFKQNDFPQYDVCYATRPL